MKATESAYVFTYHDDANPGARDSELWVGAEVLAPAYPGHSFCVRMLPNGGFFIRDMRFDAKYGMNCPNPSTLYSASAFKKHLVMMFGEWLERANEIRGMCEEGQEIGRVAGVPERFQQQHVRTQPAIVGIDGNPL